MRTAVHAAARSAKTGGAGGHVHERMNAQSIKARMLNCRLDEGTKVTFASLTCGELKVGQGRGEGHAEVRWTRSAFTRPSMEDTSPGDPQECPSCSLILMSSFSVRNQRTGGLSRSRDLRTPQNGGAVHYGS